MVYLSHSERQQRGRESLAAALQSLRLHRAVLDTISATTPLDEELVGRLKAIAPCIAAQIVASQTGRPARSSSGLVHGDVHVMACAAKHNFTSPICDMTPSLARRGQRARNTAPLAMDSGTEYWRPLPPASRIHELPSTPVTAPAERTGVWQIWSKPKYVVIVQEAIGLVEAQNDTIAMLCAALEQPCRQSGESWQGLTSTFSWNTQAPSFEPLHLWRPLGFNMKRYGFRRDRSFTSEAVPYNCNQQ